MRAMGLGVVVALGLGLAACLGPDTSVDGAAPKAENAEQRAIAAADGRVRREAGRLVLTLGNGGTMEFADYRGKPQGGQFWDAVTHVYRGRLGGGRYHLVERTAYGRTHGVLVDSASGASFSVPGVAQMSPDGDRLLILPEDTGNKRLQVWALTGPRPKIEVDAQPSRPVRFDSWQGERIVLRVPDQGVMKPLSLERSWGAWDVSELLRN